MSTPATKVVVVDDDPRLRDLLSRYLGEQGFAVRAVHHGHGPDQNLEPVELRTWTQAGKAFLSVLDRGPGIDPSEVERLKQPFTRLDPGRDGSGGSGLGLAIADRIARAHGARLDLLMRPGGGLEARVALAHEALR